MTKPFRLVAPEPSERDVHESVAQLLDWLLHDEPEVEWFAYPAGAVQLSPQQQARMTRFGLRRGMPDFFILHRSVYCIELKTPGAGLTKTRLTYTKRGSPRLLIGQDQQFPRLLRTGAVADIAVCYTAAEVIAQLDKWQIPHRKAAA